MIDDFINQYRFKGCAPLYIFQAKIVELWEVQYLARLIELVSQQWSLDSNAESLSPEPALLLPYSQNTFFIKG